MGLRFIQLLTVFLSAYLYKLIKVNRTMNDSWYQTCTTNTDPGWIYTYLKFGILLDESAIIFYKASKYKECLICSEYKKLYLYVKYQRAIRFSIQIFLLGAVAVY